LTKRNPSSSAQAKSNALPSPELARRRGDVSRALEDIGLERFPRLPSSAVEAQKIVNLAPKGESKSATDFEASRETAVSKDLADYRIVHFATHAIVDYEHPELSGIVLSLVDRQGQPRDGYLRLHDIYNLNLPADLIVLSACQTGVGKEIKGEGLIALTRGFMYAGAERVVASLWKVDDVATAELMAEFYKQMFVNGQRPAAALRAAQIALAKKRSPVDWAGFVLQGEWK
jgi:CHAT domain-containing protein